MHAVVIPVHAYSGDMHTVAVPIHAYSGHSGHTTVWWNPHNFIVVAYP